MTERSDAPQPPFNYDQGENERDETYIRRLTRHAKALEARLSETAPTKAGYENGYATAIETAAQVCDEYANDTKQRGMEERGFLTYETEAVMNCQNELGRAIRALKTAPCVEATPSRNAALANRVGILRRAMFNDETSTSGSDALLSEVMNALSPSERN